MKQPPKDSPRTTAFAFQLGLQLVVSTLVGTFLGYWLDGLWGSRPWLTVAGIFLGAGAGFHDLYRFIKNDLNQGE